MFSRVLIANRGEIAVRIARTLRRLGVESVAVYSDADAGAVHLRVVDEALRIGPALAAESYLSVERVVEAAVASGAEAVHPGYGFLSERPELPLACAEAGIAFVGPGPEAMALLGDKVEAKAVAEAAGVPVLPGLSGESLSDEEIASWVEGAELPVLLKAAAGGGGRGMRVVRERGELAEALAAARREAAAAFGDDRLLVERYLEGSRHIEVQLIADAQGNAIHLGERECSLQRRHQKVIEEAPSPVVGPALRERMGAAAVALARAAGYVNAGTVELIADREDPESFYFLEMNARLQVEHPVTEAVTGLDLVELQLRVAAGEELPLSQGDVRLDGWAVEARVYAEEPSRGFLPSTGTVVAYREPRAVPYPHYSGIRNSSVRVDSGVAEGTVVGSDYDPMLAKVVGAGADRREALAALDRALGELVLLGPGTNVAYLRALLARPEVRSGEIDTGLIERLGEEIAPPPMSDDIPATALEALLDPDPSDPWAAADGWRIAGAAPIRATLTGPDGDIDVEIEPAETDASAISRAIGGKSQTHREVVREGGAVWVLDGRSEPVRFALADEDRENTDAAHAGSLEAPMPGTVIAVRRGPGESVEEGEVLVVVESMKMELAVQSPAAGTVAEVLVAAGEQVERGQTLVLMGEDGAMGEDGGPG
ncbi:MAG TPA: biotin carboxylase N-terminal domain-containing protein [Solirubrobacterales bacterium]|nr:biotin carboxylase N-terminal domain-containing protein [Solirubrobacterales bacterium]